MEVTPAQAMEALKFIIENLRLAFFAAPRNLHYLRSSLERGYTLRASELRPRDPGYIARKGAGEPGVVTGATRNALTLGEGSLFKVTPLGLTIVGQPLTTEQLEQRKALGGGLPGYQAGARGGESSSTGRASTVDNRITAHYRFEASFGAEELAPTLKWPSDAADYDTWCKRLPVPPAIIRAVQKGRNWFTVRNGKAKRLYRGK